jgi:hypothetical protein
VILRRSTLLGALGACSLIAAASATAHNLDHPAPSFAPAAPPSPTVLAGGTNSSWELLGTISTGNPHSDLDFFTHGGEMYASVGTLGAGPNAGGQSIVKLTQGGSVSPSYVTGHPSASCLTATTSATGLQHDVEATPKGDVIFNSPNPHVDRRDAQLLLDSSDATGRCHDQGTGGVSGAPQGGIEVIDVTNPAAPKEIALISHLGQTHTVNVDPKRPHIAFSVTQDGVTIGADGKRSNETASNNTLDGFEMIDLSSCMDFPPTATIDQKRAACRPEVYRFRYPDGTWATSHTYPNNLQSCHEVEIYPDDTLACSSITATLLLNLAGAFDDNGTPTNYLDDKPRGTPLPCRVRPSSTVVSPFTTAAMVTDCVNGGTDAQPQSLTVMNWLSIGAPSLEGVTRIGTVHHMGFAGTDTIVNTPFDSTEDIVAAHESELSNSRRLVITSDERGGGVLPGGASCSPGADNARGNGGLHAFPVANFATTPPANAEQAQQAYAKDSSGNRAIYRAQVRTGPQGAFCTAHVFQQIPGQNRIFMGWYSQGTQVVDFEENPDGTVDFKEAGFFTPLNANTWTSAIFKVERNADGSFIYYGATGDGILPGTGRGAIDIFKVTLPGPPTPAGGIQPGTPVFPLADAPTGTCARTTAFDRVGARPRGLGLRVDFRRQGRAPVRVDLLRETIGRRLVRRKRVHGFGLRSSGFRFAGRRLRLRNGHYVLRFRTRTASGRTDTRLIALVRRGGRFRLRPAVADRRTCALLDSFSLRRSVFGGRRRAPLVMRVRVSEEASVKVEVRRRGRLVKRFATRLLAPGRTHSLRLRSRRRGDHRVTLTAAGPGKTDTATLTARRL